MYKRIVLNGEVTAIPLHSLPTIIHGKDGSGASLFTVSYIADLYRQGAKVLFLSGYHMARDVFLEQTRAYGEAILLEKEEMMDIGEKKRVIFVKREQPELFMNAVMSLPDSADRVILIKNIELFETSLFGTVKAHQQLVLSGDIDKCSDKEHILEIPFRSKVLFSQPKVEVGLSMPKVGKYEGYLWSEEREGVVSLMSEDGYLK